MFSRLSLSLEGGVFLAIALTLPILDHGVFEGRKLDEKFFFLIIFFLRLHYSRTVILKC